MTVKTKKEQQIGECADYFFSYLYPELAQHFKHDIIVETIISSGISLYVHQNRESEMIDMLIGMLSATKGFKNGK